MASLLSDQMGISTLCSLLLLLCCAIKHAQFVHAGDRGFQVVPVESLKPASACSVPKAATGAGRSTLNVAQRRGLCSPYGTKLDPLLTLQEDSLRVASLQRRKSGEAPQKLASQVSLPAKRGISIGTGNYIITVGFGSPKKDQTVIFDTGSDVSWIQCKPCSGSCYHQQDPLFDPSSSSTYRKVPCSSPTCGNLAINSCSGGKCIYGVQYGDNSTTVGFLAQDTLTLTSEYMFKNFVFGCGQRNQGLFGRVAGLIGLGRDPISLVSQTAEDLGSTFYYCLPSTGSSTGYLTIGGNSTAANASYTPMLKDLSAPSFYFISLTGISVGGQLLSISPTLFQTATTIIDSGTVITRLPPSAYASLRSAFRSAMSQYPMAEPLSILDTCYDFSNVENLRVPIVALHFAGGADLTLPLAGTFYVVSISRVCLAFAGNGSPTELGIIGNTQQKTVEVIYDLGAKRIGFAAGACS